jgi:hypothetical protein
MFHRSAPCLLLRAIFWSRKGEQENIRIIMKRLRYPCDFSTGIAYLASNPLQPACSGATASRTVLPARFGTCILEYVVLSRRGQRRSSFYHSQRGNLWSSTCICIQPIPTAFVTVMAQPAWFSQSTISIQPLPLPWAYLCRGVLFHRLPDARCKKRLASRYTCYVIDLLLKQVVV